MKTIIAISGPESSGKTDLALRLALHFGTWYVPEYARSYLESRGPAYTHDDLHAMIKGQLTWWGRSDERLPADGLCFWDGDPAILRIWEDERFRTSDVSLDSFVQRHPPALTLLCAPDLPWVYDPLRESRDDRERLFKRYEALLQQWGLPVAIVTGQGEARIRQAIAKVNAHLHSQPGHI